MADPIRVVLLGMPTMLRQMVRQIADGSPGVTVVAELPGPLRDPAEVVAAQPDLVVLGMDDASEQAVTDLLFASRALRVLGISADAAETTLYELRPHRMPLGELGSEALRAVIRQGVDGVR